MNQRGRYYLGKLAVCAALLGTVPGSCSLQFRDAAFQGVLTFISDSVTLALDSLLLVPF